LVACRGHEATSAEARAPGIDACAEAVGSVAIRVGRTYLRKCRFFSEMLIIIDYSPITFLGYITRDKKQDK
jgi:hypothetical protein